MSGLKEPDLAHFLRCIRFRLGGAGVLAQLAGVGRCHLSSMLHGDTARGVFTWAKVRRHVTAVEWSFLEKCSAWNSFRQTQGEVADQVLRTPVADSPRDPIMPVLCGDCGDALKVMRCAPSMGGRVSHGLCPDCFGAKMAGHIPADEIARMQQRHALADASDPACIPLARPSRVEAPELSLTS